VNSRRKIDYHAIVYGDDEVMSRIDQELPDRGALSSA
jgi:hypothetical protein